MIQYNDQVLARFRRLIDKGRLAHAYLFYGPPTTGRFEMAVAIAQLVNCEAVAAQPCGSCAACMKIKASQHPDIHVIGHNDEDTIKIDDIRQVISRIALRAFEAKVKVCIITEAQRMSMEAANALLKTLEEPAGHTLIVLTTSAPEACLDTIKSRCHCIGFFGEDEPLPADKDRVIDAFLNKSVDEGFLKELAADRLKTAQAMRIVLAFLRDAALLRNGIPAAQLIFSHRLNALRALAGRREEALMGLQSQIVRVKSLNDENLNVRMALSLVKERLCQH